MTVADADRLRQRILDAVDRDRLVERASAICDLHSPTGDEGEVAAWLEAQMRDLDMRASLQEVEPGRPNAVGTLLGRGGGRTLMFNGHMDTSFPFLLGGSGRAGLMERHLPSQVHGEWLYATGVDNMKGAFACYLGAVEALQAAGVRLDGDVVIAGVVGEVEGSPVAGYQGRAYRGLGHGTRYLLGHGALADWCILGEPTNLEVGLGNCGAVWARITTRGPVMGSYRSTWENSAMRRAHDLMDALQAWRTEYVQRHRHPGVEPPVTVAAVEGGWPFRLSRTAGSVSVYVDVRTAPDQPLISVKDELTELVRSLDPEDPAYHAEVDIFATQPGFEIDRDADIVQALGRAHAAVHGAPPAYRYSPALDDGSHLSRYGIASVVYGPGGYRRTEDDGIVNEYVRIENLVQCTRAYALTALEVCQWPNSARSASARAAAPVA